MQGERPRYWWCFLQGVRKSDKKIEFRDDIVMAGNEEVGTATLESNIHKNRL